MDTFILGAMIGGCLGVMIMGIIAGGKEPEIRIIKCTNCHTELDPAWCFDTKCKEKDA